VEANSLAAWQDRSVFVTGASGLLGGHLVAALLNAGARVTCLVRDWQPSCLLVQSDSVAQCALVMGELEDAELLTRALNEHEIDTVFHLGAQTIVGTAQRSARSTWEANVRGTWNLLEACLTCRKLLKRIVIASSDKAYGAHEHLPYTEDMPLLGQHPYDASKACAEIVSRSYATSFGLPIVVTRCGNLYGAGDLNFSRLIPGTIWSVLSDSAPLIRSDGTFIRDYFYVGDAVAAYLAAAEAVGRDQTLWGEAFNFGTETPLSVLEVVDRILAHMQRRDLAPQILNQASHEIPRQYLDCTKAKSKLAWRPQFTFEQGLQETIGWYGSRWQQRASANVRQV
jgi:CDP-glucose 4,6-dehydratase